MISALPLFEPPHWSLPKTPLSQNEVRPKTNSYRTYSNALLIRLNRPKHWYLLFVHPGES